MASSLAEKVCLYAQDQEYHRTPLIWAGRHQEADVIRYVLEPLSPQERRRELDTTDDWGYTALHWACSVKLDSDLGAMRALLELGADPNIVAHSNPACDDVTPLLKAVESANPRAVQLLLDWSAQVTLEELETAENYGLTAISHMLEES